MKTNPRQREAKQKVRTKTISMSSMVGQWVGSFFMSVRTMNCSQSAFFPFSCFFLSWLSIMCVWKKHFQNIGLFISAFYHRMPSFCFSLQIHMFIFLFFFLFLPWLFCCYCCVFFFVYLAHFGRATVKRFFLSSQSMSWVCNNVWLRCIVVQINLQAAHNNVSMPIMYWHYARLAQSLCTSTAISLLSLRRSPFFVLSLSLLTKKKLLRRFFGNIAFSFFVSFALLFYFMLHFIVIIISLNIRFDMYICVFRMIAWALPK